MIFNTRKAATQRVKRHQETPQDVTRSAWVYTSKSAWWFDLLIYVTTIGGVGPILLRMFWWTGLVLIALAVFLQPMTGTWFDWTYLAVLNLVGVCQILGYIGDAACKTPWKDRSYPTVMPVYHNSNIVLPIVLFLCGFILALPLLEASFTTPFYKTNFYDYPRSFSFALFFKAIYADPLSVAGHLLMLQALVIAWILLFQPSLFCTHLRSDDFERAGWPDRATQRVVSHNTESADSPAEDVPFQARQPKVDFSRVDGMSELKQDMLARAKLIVSRKGEHEGDDPRNGILLHGEPGNGKTFFAEALAGELKVPFIEVTIGPMSSEWLGKQPRVLAQTFAYAKRQAPCVLFIDEIDSFIRSRDASSGNSEDVKIANTILTEIVGLRGSGVVLIGATNYLDKLDAAAIREGRFDFKIEVPSPDLDARMGILKNGMRKYVPRANCDAAELQRLAARWNGFSVTRLQAICKTLPDVVKQSGQVEFAHWMSALRRVQGRKGQVPADAKPLTSLLLPQEAGSALKLIASRIGDLDRIERLGGSLPTGILFHGPSGTGKTAAAKAIAKESGWAFLAVAGPDLLTDKDRLDKLYAQAKDLRPALVFIDEADEVLQDRRYSQHGWVVNKLLTVMDGAADRVKDVVWIAATNHPDQIDPALLRPGRFTEKIGFLAPDGKQLPLFIDQWLAQRRHIRLELAGGVGELADLLGGATVAEAEGVLQYALNLAIGETQARSGSVSINPSHVQRSMNTVLGTYDT